MKLQLHWIAEAGSLAGEGGRVPAGRRRWERAGWLLAAAFFLLLMAAGVERLWLPRVTTWSRVTRFAVGLPSGQKLGGSGWWYRSIALSADGSEIAYVGTRNGVSQIYLRPMNDLTARALPGTESAHTPFFSPDGQWLGLVLNDKLVKIPVAGGPPVSVASLSGFVGRVYGACWAPGDTIYFGTSPPRGVLKVAAAGGTPQSATKLDASRQETDHRYPEVLPGGKVLLFTVRNATQPSFDEADIAAVSIVTGERRMLIKGGTDPHYLSSGHLVFLRAGVILAVRRRSVAKEKMRRGKHISLSRA